MSCTCRVPARCPVCNTPIRVPLTYLESATGGALIVDRFARRDSATSRDALYRLMQGYCPCPACGNTVHHNHSRSCVANALASAGVPSAEREAILAKITFPEG